MGATIEEATRRPLNCRTQDHQAPRGTSSSACASKGEPTIREIDVDVDGDVDDGSGTGRAASALATAEVGSV
jgi:hypothetical protein